MFNHWSMEEIEEMDAAFQISLKGGMRLGKETLSRLQFAGFDYEINGSTTRVAKPQREVFNVFDEEFSSFREALAFASATYKMQELGKVYSLSIGHGFMHILMEAVRKIYLFCHTFKLITYFMCHVLLTLVDVILKRFNRYYKLN